jgi:hypothetical protein
MRFIDRLQLIANDRIIIAGPLLVISLMLFGAAWYEYQQPRHEPNYDQKRSKDIAQCIGFSKHKGFSSKRPNPHLLELTSDKFDDPKFTFSTVESIVLGCPNLDLKSFCLGVKEECGIQGVKMVLGYEKPDAF